MLFKRGGYSLLTFVFIVRYSQPWKSAHVFDWHRTDSDNLAIVVVDQFAPLGDIRSDVAVELQHIALVHLHASQEYLREEAVSHEYSDARSATNQLTCRSLKMTCLPVEWMSWINDRDSKSIDHRDGRVITTIVVWIDVYRVCSSLCSNDGRQCSAWPREFQIL